MKVTPKIIFVVVALVLAVISALMFGGLVFTGVATGTAAALAVGSLGSYFLSELFN